MKRLYIYLKKSGIISVFLLAMLLLAIWWGGPKLSQWCYTNEKENIDKNAVVIKARVRYISYMKGDYAMLDYVYKSKKYSMKDYFLDKKNAFVGEKVLIKIDTTDASQAYSIRYLGEE